ncbi:MAG: DUF2141 domain-containing protein [Myxococcota bacterium]
MTQRTLMLAILGAILVLGSPAFAAEGDGVLKVEVENIENDKGNIGCSLWTKEDGFPSDTEKALERVTLKPKDKKATCVFKNVKPGTYAVSVMHDVDADGELDSNFVGRPQEPWAVSNNVPAERFGPPKFEATQFKYSGKASTIKVKLTL